MTAFFNAAEVYEMGVDVERNGERFYRKAMEKTKDPDLRTMLECFADQEKGHMALFQELKARLPAGASSPSPLDDEDVGLYLQALADSKVFKTKDDVDKALAKVKSLEDALDLALRFEKESILFFQWARDMTRQDWGREKIDQLIAEERQHIGQLGSCLVKAKDGYYA